MSVVTRTYVDYGYDRMAATLGAPVFPMRIDGKSKFEKLGWLGNPRWDSEQGKHGWCKWCSKSILIVRERWKGTSRFQALYMRYVRQVDRQRYSSTNMVKKFGLLVRDLLEDGHYKFEAIFGDGDRMVAFWVFTLLRAPTGPRAGHGALRTGSFSSSLLVVLVQPLFVTFIHVVDEAVDESERDSLFGGIRGLEVGDGILPSAGLVKVFIVVDFTGAVGRRDIGGRGGGLSLCAPRRTRRGMMSRSCGGEDRLQVMLLKGDDESAFHGTIFPRFQPIRASHTVASNNVAHGDENRPQRLTFASSASTPAVETTRAFSSSSSSTIGSASMFSLIILRRVLLVTRLRLRRVEGPAC